MLSALVIGPEDNLMREFLDKAAWIRDLRICCHVSRYPPPADLLNLLQQHEPDVGIVSLADYDRASRTISRILSGHTMPIVAVHVSCESQVLLELMQLGVRELWFPPFDTDQMQQTVARFLAQKTAAPPAGPAGSAAFGSLIAFLPARGGCGATTAAVHTAAALQKRKGSVLLADFDFHNSTIAFWMKATPRHGLQEALERAHWLDSALWKSMVNRIGELEILTAPQTSAPMVFSSSETCAVLEYARRNYHFVLVDLPDAIYSSCWEVLEQASQILLVATPEMGGLYLARRKIAQIVDRGIPRDRVRILLNRSSPADLSASHVEKFLSIKVAASFGNHYRAVTAAFSEGRLVPADSKLGIQFDEFAADLAGMPKKKENKAGAWKIRQIFSPA